MQCINDIGNEYYNNLNIRLITCSTIMTCNRYVSRVVINAQCSNDMKSVLAMSAVWLLTHAVHNDMLSLLTVMWAV